MSNQPNSFNLEIDEKLAEKVQEILSDERLVQAVVHARQVITNGTEENFEH